MKTTILALAAALAAAGAAAPALANAPDPAPMRWEAESRWIRAVERRLDRALDAPDLHTAGERVAEVRFELDEAGAVRGETLRLTSGMRRFDAAALRAVAALEKLPPPPPTLAGRPIVFRAVLTPQKAGQLGPR